MGIEKIPKILFPESVIELTEAEPNALGLILEPSAPSRLGLASKRPRLESTYLEVTPPGSRRSSHSSLQVDMHDVQSEARKSFRVKICSHVRLWWGSFAFSLVKYGLQ